MSRMSMMQKLGLTDADFKPKPKFETRILEITEEDFNLLDFQDEHTIYYIFAEDGTVTIRKGENL